MTRISWKQYIDDCVCCEKCDKIGFMCNEDCELPDCVTPQWERVLNEQQTVDAEPVRHGKWITKSTGGEYFDCCSECGYVEWDAPNNYCPHCGAKMDEGTE